MTPSSRQIIGCCLSTSISLLHLALIKNGSQLKLVNSLSLPLHPPFRPRDAVIANPCSASCPCRLHRSPDQTVSPANSSYRHDHNVFLFLLPDLFHIIHRHDVGVNRFHGMLFIRHPVSVTVQSSIPYTFSGNRPQNKGPPPPSPPLHTSAFPCGSTPTLFLAAVGSVTTLDAGVM